MALSTTTRVFLASAVILTGSSFSVPVVQASQVQLHELLFNRAKRKQRKQVQQRIVAPQRKQVAKKKRAPIKRIRGPQYYTYKAPKMATLTLAGLTTASVDGQSVGALGVPMMNFETSRFREAVKAAPILKMTVEANIAKVVTDHYSKNPSFLWSRGTGVTADAKELAALLNDAPSHGLIAEHYSVSVPEDGFSLDKQVERSTQLLEFEMHLTARAIRYALDMKDGAINPNKISGYHDFTKERLTPEAALASLISADGNSAADFLSTLIPKQPHYTQLQDELVRLRASTEDSIVFPPKVFLKPGSDDEVMPILMKAIDRKLRDETREKHKPVLESYAGTTVYGEEIVELVRDVQRDLGLVPDGIVGPKTVARLDGVSLAAKIQRVELALERLRWHPEQYGKRQVVINQPEYRVRYLEDGETKLAMRAIVGKPANQTNFFHDEIETVVFNPYWGVPQSIIVNEMLPRLRRDPGYLDRAGYVVTTAGGKKVSSYNVNWSQFGGRVPYNIRQKPGPRNALGELKILFPNKHAIYMHDTPAKKLFQRDSRAFSHGCVRLHDPRAMAAAVLGKDKSYVASKLGGPERAEKVTGKIPVYIGYFTAWPDDTGKVQYHPDMYKRDTYLSRAVQTVLTARAESS